MKDLSQLLTAHAYPAGLDRIRRSFARQPDCQTCGAAAIRHGLLLGGLTIPTATLEAILGIRDHEGTPPDVLRICLQSMGLQPALLRKPARQKTAAFLDSLATEFARGAFLLPCVRNAEHWVCVGGWHEGRVGLVDSFFDRRRPCGSPHLGFLTLTVEEFDALDWPHFVTLVRPGIWRLQYRAWLAARQALLRMQFPKQADGRPVTVVQAIRLGAHQYLDDEDYSYRQLDLSMAGGATVSVEADDPGGDAVGVEVLGDRGEEVVVVRRLGGVLQGYQAAPEVIFRANALHAGQLAG
ncbi:MAG: hypothetical protein U0736_18020 [Gemmataceae bacterium]